jgi:hypothetical protein
MVVVSALLLHAPPLSMPSLKQKSSAGAWAWDASMNLHHRENYFEAGFERWVVPTWLPAKLR